jgi:hypothetical protein
MTLSNDSRETQWDDLFALRKPLRYKLADTRLISTEPDTLSDKRKLILKFFGTERVFLHPPDALRYPALYRFLENDHSKEYKTPYLLPNPEEIVLLDERNDLNGDENIPRQWDSTGPNGYLQYPPSGEVQMSKPMRLPDLLKRLSTSVIQDSFWTLCKS